MKRKSLKVFIALLFFFCGFGVDKSRAQNLLDLTGWTIGQGTSGIFTMNGQTSENIREWGEGPHGDRVILWTAAPAGDNNNDGGWGSQPFSINHTQMYRFIVWMKKSNSKDGAAYFGCSHVNNLNGTPNTNPYFWYGDPPVLDRWYLLVSYVHASNDTTLTSYGGLYDGVTGVKTTSFKDFKFIDGAVNTLHRSYLFYDPNLNDRQYFYAPRVDLVNGNEPSIAELLGLQNSSSSPAYFSGKVGIKTTNPGDYDLAVNGKIRTQEVKVETANWPDYVFKTDYKPMPIPELKKFIEKNNHLPEIPSAKELESNGLSLGEMNKLLIKKIEELTLLLIDQHEQGKAQSKEISELKSEVTDLKNKL